MRKRVLELRALPALEEKRNSLIDEMENLVNKAKEETRAMDEKEVARYETIKAEIAGIDKTLAAENETRTLEKKVEVVDKKEETRTQEEIDNEELRDIFNGKKQETRANAAMNTGTSNEGGIVVNKQLTGAIIKKLKDRSNVLGFFNMTSIPGVCKIPKKASSGTATWEDEQFIPNTTSKATIPTLNILELSQYRLYRESAITQQMLNAEEIDLRGFIIDDISETMTDALELAVFKGDGNKKPKGILGDIPVEKQIALAVRGTITLDDLKKCKAKLKREAQNGARWFMCQDTFLAIDLLKDGMGRPILNPDIARGEGYTLLGLPVELTDAMPTMVDTGAQPIILLAAPQAYHINMQKQLAMYIYDDSSYKRAGLIGYASDIYLDGKIKNDDYCASIVNKA